MEHRLAGQHSGDRRRRRMSSDLQDEELFHEFFPEVAAVRQAHAPVAWTQGASIPLLRRLISPRLWKHAVLLMAGVVGLAAVLWWEHAPAHAAVNGPQSINTSAALASSGLTGLLLLISGQLALCIGLLRATSLVDFQGRYRWWKWLAAGLIARGIMVTTDTTRLVSDALVAMLQPLTGQIQAAKQTLLLVPALTFCLIVLGRILPDMTRSPLSLSLLVLALLTFTVRLLLVHSDAARHVPVATLSGLYLSAAYAVFAAMLLHCRFVAYVCHDPPERQACAVPKHADAVAVAQSTAETQPAPPNVMATADGLLTPPSDDCMESDSYKTTDSATHRDQKSNAKKSRTPARKSRRAA